MEVANMNFYLTYGTHHFLKTIYEKHKNKQQIYLMDGDDSSILILEKSGKSLFHSGKQYGIYFSNGSYENATFAVINNIPVPQDEAEVFQFEAQKRATIIKRQAGCLAVRVLTPAKKGDSFLILSMWDSSGDFRRFQDSSEYKGKQITKSTLHPQQLFTGKAYEKTYSVYREELEDS